MATKIPKKYRKPIPEKVFQRKIIRRIHLDRERTFVEEAFRRDSEGRYTVREDISEAEVKRLATVLKEIRKNAGFLKFGRLAIVLILLVGALLFNYLYKDRLLEEAGERLLETVFQAKSEITGLHFDPFAGSIVIEEITIADRNAPMENLIQLGPSELSILSSELLKGNLVIRSLSASDLAFGTTREESGAIEGVEPRESSLPGVAERGEAAARDTLNALGLGSVGADPEAVVREFASQLRSREVVRELSAQAEAAEETWRARVAGTAESVEALRGDVASLQGRRIEDISTVQGALEALEDAKALRTRAEALYSDLESSRSEVQSLVETVTEGRQRLEAAIEEDYAALRSQLPSFDVDPSDFATRTTRLFLENFLGETYGRTISLIDRFENFRQEIPTRQEGPRRGGYDVPFSSVTFPRFYLQRADASGGDGSTAIEATIEHLSSAPSVTGRPLGLSYRQTQSDENRGLELTAAIDLRDEVEELGEYTLTLTGLRPSLPRGLDSIGFTSLEADTSIGISGLVSRDGSMAGRMDVIAAEPSLGLSESAGATVRLLTEVIASEPSVEAELAYRIEEGRITDFSGTTTLAAAVSRRVRQLIDQVRERFETRVREELNALLEGELRQYVEASEALRNLSERSLEELRKAETYREAAAEQQRAIEERLQQFRDELEQRAREEVERRTQEAREEVERQTQEARERLEEEEAKAREQLEEEARDRLKLPFGN